MPGMENLAPERTETRSGLLGSPKFLPVLASTAFSASRTSSQRPAGSCLPAVEVVVAGLGRDREAGRNRQPGVASSRRGRRPCRRAGPSWTRCLPPGRRPRRRCSAWRPRGRAWTVRRRAWGGFSLCSCSGTWGRPAMGPMVSGAIVPTGSARGRDRSARSRGPDRPRGRTSRQRATAHDESRGALTGTSHRPKGRNRRTIGPSTVSAGRAMIQQRVITRSRRADASPGHPDQAAGRPAGCGGRPPRPARSHPRGRPGSRARVRRIRRRASDHGPRADREPVRGAQPGREPFGRPESERDAVGRPESERDAAGRPARARRRRPTRARA